MRLLVVKIITCSLIVVAAAAVGSAQERKNKTHVFLLDVSGSMDNDDRYVNLKEWLVRPLLRSGAFAEGDSVIVRWFSQAKGASLDPRYDARVVSNARYSEQVVLDHIPGPGQAKGKFTDIPQALALTLEDIKTLKINGDVFIWLLTDNDQESGVDSPSGENRMDIKPLYKGISEDKNFRAAYLFPLINENGVKLGNEKNAMILYLLHYSLNSPWPGLEALAGEVGKGIGNPTITWFPFEKGIVPDLEPMAEEDVQFNGDTLILPPVPEGQTPYFDNLRFKLKSQLRSRSLSGQLMPNALVELTLPPSVVARGEATLDEAPPAGEGGSEEPPATQPSEPASASDVIRLNVSIHPSEISLGPGQKSDKVYTVSLSSPITLHPDGFWTAVGNSESAPVTGILQFHVENLETHIQSDDSALEKVKNHEFIKRVVGQSIITNRPFSIEVAFRVTYNSRGRIITLVIVAILVLALCAALLILFRSKTRYALTTPEGERIVALPVIGRGYIPFNGNRVAVISKRFGKLSITPLTNYLIDGSSNVRPLSDGGQDLMVEDQQSGQRHQFFWRRVGREVRVNTALDDFYD